tara:strand:- start:1613 stop:2956 length:1344 start_codon:yes stop_codon:yes gene_type:complete
MAGSPPVDPPDTGASGLGGGNVDPEHALIYTGKWPFGDPNNPRPDSDSPGVTELGVNTSAVGEGSIYDDMFPFKLQWFIDDDPESETYRQRRLRIYTGMLTAMINTFTYHKSKDTDTTYSGSVNVTIQSCTGPMATSTCTDAGVDTGEHASYSVSTKTGGTPNKNARYIEGDDPADGMQDDENPHLAQEVEIAAQTINTNTGQGAGVGGGTDSFSHTHPVTVVVPSTSHTHDIPDHYHVIDIPSHSHAMGQHKHFTKDFNADPEAPDLVDVDLSVSSTRCDIEKFLTVDGQPAIQGPLQIEPNGFVDMTRINVDGVEVPTGFRAQTLEHAYGDVYLTWDLNTDKDNLGGAADGVVTNVNIAMINPATTNAGQLTRAHWAADRNPDIGSYRLLIGTAFDPDSEDEQEASKGIVQVIYENVYYSPLILPEIEDSSGSPSCDSPVTTTWN